MTLLPADADRARARQLRDERVDEIIRLMSRGEWQGERSHAALAEQWELSPHTVTDYAREASSIIRRIVDGDKREVLAEILAGVRYTRQLALGKVRVAVSKGGDVHEYADPDVRSAIAADELTLKALGLLTVKVQDVSPLEGLSPAELEQRRQDVLRRLADAKEPK